MNWKITIQNKINTNNKEKDHELTNLASDWNTCPAGNVDKRIPRIGRTKIPWDGRLAYIGWDFLVQSPLLTGTLLWIT
jgi:hypothetical protein